VRGSAAADRCKPGVAPAVELGSEGVGIDSRVATDGACRRADERLAGVEHNGAMDPAHLRVGIYRDPAIVPTASLYVDGITVSSSREAAEADAYATP